MKWNCVFLWQNAQNTALAEKNITLNVSHSKKKKRILWSRKRFERMCTSCLKA